MSEKLANRKIFFGVYMLSSALLLPPGLLLSKPYPWSQPAPNSGSMEQVSDAKPDGWKFVEPDPPLSGLDLVEQWPPCPANDVYGPLFDKHPKAKGCITEDGATSWSGPLPVVLMRGYRGLRQWPSGY